MGGAICFCSYQRRPDLFAGIVFVAPMCKISDKLAPPPIVKKVLLWIAGPVGSSCWGSLLPYLPIAPVKNVSKSSVRIESKRHLMTSAPVSYTRKPRLATARELSNATEQISRDLPNLDAPFLIIHGKDDRVTDPALSQALYEEAKSNDKTLKLYDGTSSIQCLAVCVWIQACAPTTFFFVALLFFRHVARHYGWRVGRKHCNRIQGKTCAFFSKQPPWTDASRFCRILLRGYPNGVSRDPITAGTTTVSVRNLYKETEIVIQIIQNLESILVLFMEPRYVLLPCKRHYIVEFASQTGHQLTQILPILVRYTPAGCDSSVHVGQDLLQFQQRHHQRP